MLIGFIAMKRGYTEFFTLFKFDITFYRKQEYFRSRPKIWFALDFQIQFFRPHRVPLALNSTISPNHNTINFSVTKELIKLYYLRVVSP